MTDLIESKLTVGDIVKSTAGRGSGRIYLVVKSLENGYVYISDGKTRKINNAKLKKNKHLVKLGNINDLDFLDAPGGTADAEIRKILKECSEYVKRRCFGS